MPEGRRRLDFRLIQDSMTYCRPQPEHDGDRERFRLPLKPGVPMSEELDVFVSAIVEHFGEKAYPFALEQVGHAAQLCDERMASLWAEIAAGIAIEADP